MYNNKNYIEYLNFIELFFVIVLKLLEFLVRKV